MITKLFIYFFQKDTTLNRQLSHESYYDYQLSKVGQMFGYIPGFSIYLVLLSHAAGSVSSGNLLAFDVIGSKTYKIAGNKLLPLEMRNVALWQH